MKFSRIATICLFILSLSTVVAQERSIQPRIQFAQQVDPSVPAAEGRFGSSVAFGSVADGAPLYAAAPGVGNGEIERHVTSGGGWVADGCKITPASPQAGAGFASNFAVAGSGANTRIAVSEPMYDQAGGFTDQGRVLIFAPSGGCMSQIGVINPPANAAQQRFGFSVDIVAGASEIIAIVGAPTDGSGGGTAYIYSSVNGGTSWTLQSTLTGNPVTVGAKFGHAVAIDGLTTTPTVIVGAPDETNFGSVYVYRRVSGTWTLDQKIGESLANIYGNAGFGAAVDVAVSASDTYVALTCTTCTPSASAVPRIFVLKRTLDMPNPGDVSYVDDFMITSSFNVGVDLELKFHADGTNISVAFASQSYYAEIWTRAESLFWTPEGFYNPPTGVVLTSTAFLVTDRLYIAAGQPAAAQDALANAGTVWATAPDSDGIELIANGDFEDPFSAPTTQPWTLLNPSGDKRKCNGSNCYFQFKGHPSDTTMLEQYADISSYNLSNGDTFTLSADIKTLQENSGTRLKLRINMEDDSFIVSKLKFTPSLSWSTLTIPPIVLECQTAVSIRAWIKYKGRAGKLHLDNVSLIGENGTGGACEERLPEPVLPIPLAP